MGQCTIRPKGITLTAEMDVKQQVREFYDSVGWKSIGEGLYQNARYEDLRPVSREYIHRCHLRVGRFIPQDGKFLLDAGSGPIQYPEYLEYSKDFRYRVCLDISILALKEARERIRDHGLYVQGDIANLPFKSDAFEGIISLHTIHHLPENEQRTSFSDLLRTLRPSGMAAVVYSWGINSPLMKLFSRPISWTMRILQTRREKREEKSVQSNQGDAVGEDSSSLIARPGTFTYKHGYDWIMSELDHLPGLEVRVWRTVSTAFMRAFIHRKLLGRLLLRVLYAFEEIIPKTLGRYGQYPIILFYKPESSTFGEG
jgi:ubiquinone/menaquinone biosynthesis C-methylase UbiE